MKDYYKILGLAPDCSQEEIKKAYRKLARNFHPDSCRKEDSTAFREVQEAYEAIGEKSNKNNYDQQRRAEQQRSQTGPIYSFPAGEPDSGYPFTFESYFDQIMNRFFTVDPFYSRSAGLNNQLDLILTPEEARTGGIIPVEAPIYQSCPVEHCHFNSLI